MTGEHNNIEAEYREAQTIIFLAKLLAVLAVAVSLFVAILL
jgi:hypothetical protein